jgi:ferredoxin--NADP+ reductase
MWPIKVGDRMFCRAVATGHFTLKDTIGEDDQRIKLMVAAGTGLAPFISIARSRLRRDPAARLDDLAIIHAASYATGLGYRAELEQMAEKNGLKYLPTVSRPKEVPGWTGFAGRAEALLEPGLLGETEKALGLGPGEFRPDRVAVLICGLNGTIANTIIALLSRGFIPDNRKIRRALELEDAVPSSIFWEQYDNTPVIDVKDEALMTDLRARLRAAL